MDLSQAVGWLAAAVAVAWALSGRKRDALLLHAAEAVSFTEKYFRGASEETLEGEALRYFEAHWPSVPAVVVKALVREICRRRKLRARGLAPGK